MGRDATHVCLTQAPCWRLGMESLGSGLEEGEPIDPAFLALSRFRRRKFDESIAVCTELLEKQPLDRAVWFIKCRALTQQVYIDDTDIEDEGLAELMMDDDSMAKMPRPGTSLKRPGTQSGQGINQHLRPMTRSGRPLTGFARPGTGARPLGTAFTVENAYQGSRPATSRPMSVAGRFLRLGTASMLSDPNGPFVDPSKIDLAKKAKHPAEAKALMDYLLFREKNPNLALQLADHATKAAEFKDWWWKWRLAKCYYQLSMLRDAEKQLRSAIRQHEHIALYLDLAKVFFRFDQPMKALEPYCMAAERFYGESSVLSAMARLYDAVSDLDRAAQFYRRVLYFDSSNVEALASLASFHFYNDQPEVALRFYRRLLQMGVNNAEIWTNLGLCCFYSSQYDMTLLCFEKALALAEDDSVADVWYNIGQVAIGIGDLNLAYQAYKISLSFDPNHAESLTNVGVLELKKGSTETGRQCFIKAQEIAPHLFETYYNGALVAFRLGDCQESYDMANKALEAFPDHADSKELIKQLRRHFELR